MNDQPSQLAIDLVAIAARVMESDGDEIPAPDFMDDRDVAVVFVISLAIGLGALIESRDDLGDGLLSGRYALAIDHTGTTLLENPAAA